MERSKKPPPITCKRCNELKEAWSFYEESALPGVCEKCFTKQEYLDHVQPPLTKLMRGLKPTQKARIIRELLKQHKKKQMELVNV